MIAGISFAPAALLVLTLIAVAVLRSRSTAAKIGCEVIMLLLIGVTLVDRGTSPLPMDDNLAHAIDAPWLRALAVVWWLIAARLVATLTALGLGRDARSRQARLFSDLLAGGIYLTAVLIILNSVLNLPVKGLLATSGVIAIVLGLALQNTLADVFSGIAVGLEQPFHVGDRITIADHAEGIVIEMNWRSIRIQTDGEDVATIPNSIVARSQIINRSVPTERRGASIEIPTLSSARSERLVDLVHQALLLCPDILVAPAPSVALKRIGTRTTTDRRQLFRRVHRGADASKEPAAAAGAPVVPACGRHGWHDRVTCHFAARPDAVRNPCRVSKSNSWQPKPLPTVSSQATS